jgi:hypothetical protein
MKPSNFLNGEKDLLVRFLLLMLPGLAFVAPAVAQTQRNNQSVGAVYIDARPCTFFQLQGVSEADTATPGPWFSVPATNPNYQIIVSALFTAKATQARVSVHTDGTLSCGHSTANVVALE